LREAAAWVDALPAKEGRVLEKQAIFDRIPDRDKLLGEIDRELKEGIEGAVPQIESIGFATSLELLELSGIEASVHYRRGHREYIAYTVVDLTDPVRSTRQIIDALGT
jgi:hypothetical protein